MRLDHRERASEREVMMVAMVLASMVANRGKKKTAHVATWSYTVTILIQCTAASARIDLPTVEMVEKSKIRLNISVGYNCHQ